MIYILVGGDREKNNTFLNKNIQKGLTPIFYSDFNKEMILNEALSNSFFGNENFYVFDNLISDNNIDFKDAELKTINDSPKIFVLREDKLTVLNEKKYKKFSNILRFEKKIKKPKGDGVFEIADYLGLNNKLKAWIFYRKAIDMGIEPEAISGVLFWKVKSMITSGSKIFKTDDLKKMSSSLVCIYHDSHLGKGDMALSLEKFILSSLNK